MRGTRRRNMKFRLFCKYFLIGSLISLPKGIGDFHKTDASAQIKQTVQMDMPSVDTRINLKAKELCDTYIGLVLQGQTNIKNGRGSHKNSVLREFPGANTRWYCIYGQYVQLNRALNELGDTLCLIPFEARHSCPEFRKQMKQKYSGSEYTGVLYNGKMFKSDTEFNRAMNAFLKHNHITNDSPKSARDSAIARFKRNNFKATDLHPGAIIIVQHNNSSSNTHAIMYLGRGRVKDNQFIPDDSGAFIYAGYNNESVGDIFKTYNTNHMFVADIYNIARADYTKEFNKLIGMKHDDLFRFVYDTPSDVCWATPTNQQLKKLATEKYFNKAVNIPAPIMRMDVASFPILPMNLFGMKQR